MSLPKAVLWDMDGTLVDTEPYWMQCEFVLAEKYGGTWTDENALAVVGGDLLDSASYMREHMGIDRTPRQIVDELLVGVIELVRQRVPWRPGAPELLAALNEAEVPCALVTMSWRSFVEPVVEALPPGAFAEVVCGDEVPRGKPFPDPYLIAAERFGVTPGETIAIEDSPTGLASAANAGCRVLVVPSHVTVPIGHGQAVERPTLEGLSPHDLVPLFE